MRGWTVCLVLVALHSGCGYDIEVPLAPLEDSGFGAPEANLGELDAEAIGEIMTTVLLRNRMYSALRTAVPLNQLLNGTDCHANVLRVDETYIFEAAMACTVPEPLSAGSVEGEVIRATVREGDVYFITLDYLDVSVPGATVSGQEHLTELVGGGGATEVVLDIVQDGFTLAYTFRMTQLAENTPAFDYEVSSPAGVVVVRLTNPVTAGAFATATLSGVDVSLNCEIRDAAWSPGDPARGTCEGGIVYGL